ncbi:MAG: penicillin-binding protein 1C [Verrucomicrobiota bacterium]
MLLICLAGIGGFSFALRLVPLPAALFQPAAPEVELVDRHGVTLRQQFGEHGLLGQRVALGAIAPSLVEATLAAEDKRFWEHSGVDVYALGRAVWGLVKNGHVVSGASTITQQTIKLAQPRPRTVRSKIIESLQALRLEQVWTKEQILAEYLNRLDYGNRRTGIAAAAHYYFNKPPADLSLAESALLAAIPQAPTRLNPYLRFAATRKRQQWILTRMEAEGWLTATTSARAAREPLRLAAPRRVFQAPHFVDLLLQQVPEGRLRHGTVVRTSLDLDLNRLVEKTVQDRLKLLNRQQARNGAAVVLDNRTGEVLALVGSEDYFADREGQVNGAWAPRSAGSTFKPFTYLLALERGATPASMVADIPTEFTTPTGLFAPVNYNRQCFGPLRYRLALANSLNIPAVRVLNELGGPVPLQQRLRRCGLTTLTNSPEFYGLGLTIGNAEARLLELANAFACLARLGAYKPYSFFDQPGAGASRVFDANAAWLIADILSDNFARAMAFDLYSSLRFPFPVACKTGTSSDFRDNWAFGYTPEFTVGVWVGNFDGTPMEHVSGVTGAAPILHAILVHLHEQHGTTWYELPAEMVTGHVHRVTGKRVPANHPEAVLEKFIAGHLPPMETPEDYDSAGRIRLPVEYREWLAGGENWLGDRAVGDGRPKAESRKPKAEHGGGSETGTLRLISPLPGTVIFLDPDLPGSGNRLRLKAEGQGSLSWHSSTLPCETDELGTTARLSEGRHEITVRDQTGATATTWITVKSL